MIYSVCECECFELIRQIIVALGSDWALKSETPSFVFATGASLVGSALSDGVEKASFHRLPDLTHWWQTLTAVPLSDRKRCPWWVRSSPYSSPPPTLRPQPCTWRPRWRRRVRSARPPSRVRSPPSRSGWGPRHKAPGKEPNTSMAPGESGQARVTGEHRFLDYLTGVITGIFQYSGNFHTSKMFIVNFLTDPCCQHVWMFNQRD